MVHLAQSDEASCDWEVVKGNPHPHVAGAQSQETPNTKHEGDVESSDAERRHRGAQQPRLHTLQDRH